MQINWSTTINTTELYKNKKINKCGKKINWKCIEHKKQNKI